MKRVLICANPDLNYIDGSSVWSQTITLAIAATGAAKVDFLARSPQSRSELFIPFKSSNNVHIIDGTDGKYWDGHKRSRLSPELMASLAIRLANSYDIIVVRGLHILEALSDSPATLEKCWVYLTDIPQKLEEYTFQQKQLLGNMGRQCKLLLCQTDGFISIWKNLLSLQYHHKIRLYEPLIPDILDNQKTLDFRKPNVIYAGKFKKEWMTLEMTQAWADVYPRFFNSKFIVIGDKIHNDKDDHQYKHNMLSALERTPGINWLGAKPRTFVQEHLLNARVGVSWRAETMNKTIELSTKVLEYGGAGCAAIINRNTLHEKLFDKDYPLFANNYEEFKHALQISLSDLTLTQNCANILKSVAKEYTFSKRVEKIRLWLDERTPTSNAINVLKVLVAGHDFKFLQPILKRLSDLNRYEFIIDEWQGHDKHSEVESVTHLSNAELVFCEWSLGNLKWYSKHKKAGQILVSRFHAQEIRSPLIHQINWNNVDHLIFVSEHMRSLALKHPSLQLDRSKTSVIPNYIDASKFNRLPKMGDSHFCLGLLGYVPQSKRVDRALDLMEILIARDRRYTLRIKGRHALSYDWIINNSGEFEYYNLIFERINSNPLLRYNVIFDPPGDDVNQWFSLVGYILSPSDHESFHMAIGEGILTGTFPVIWDWEGAEQLWGPPWIVHSAQDAADLIIDINKDYNTYKPKPNIGFNIDTISQITGLFDHLITHNVPSPIERGCLSK
jgi:glycosyltransferase involved in cell wall biosynthesis